MSGLRSSAQPRGCRSTVDVVRAVTPGTRASMMHDLEIIVAFWLATFRIPHFWLLLRAQRRDLRTTRSRGGSLWPTWCSQRYTELQALGGWRRARRAPETQ